MLAAYHVAALLAALGMNCLTGFWRQRTLHCVITGPLFLIAAVVVATGHGTIAVSLVWPLLLMGVGIAFLLEGRYAT